MLCTLFVSISVLFNILSSSFMYHFLRHLFIFIYVLFNIHFVFFSIIFYILASILFFVTVFSLRLLSLIFYGICVVLFKFFRSVFFLRPFLIIFYVKTSIPFCFFMVPSSFIQHCIPSYLQASLLVHSASLLTFSVPQSPRCLCLCATRGRQCDHPAVKKGKNSIAMHVLPPAVAERV